MSLGNLGYSSTQCTRVPFTLNQIPMYCAYGNITTIKYLGVNPSGMSDKDSCYDDAPEVKDCLKAMNPAFLLSVRAKVSSQNTDNIIYTFKPAEFFTDLTTVPSKCTDSVAQLYVQYSCEQSQIILTAQIKSLSMVTSLCVFSVCLFLIVIYYFKKSSTLLQLDWDISTITPGDYTLQLEITTDMWEHYLKEHYHKDDLESQGVSSAFALKTYMKKEIERILTNTLKNLRLGANEALKGIKIQEVKIADISFAFNNAELINLLRERGGYIAGQSYDEMRKVEAKISALKDEKYENLTKPVDAFITFEEEDGSIIGQYFENKQDKVKADFLGSDLILSESTEPTNIIWENRHWTARDLTRRTIEVFAIITVLILVSFGLIFFCKQFSIKISN